MRRKFETGQIIINQGWFLLLAPSVDASAIFFLSFHQVPTYVPHTSVRNIDRFTQRIAELFWINLECNWNNCLEMAWIGAFIIATRYLGEPYHLVSSATSKKIGALFRHDFPRNLFRPSCNIARPKPSRFDPWLLATILASQANLAHDLLPQRFAGLGTGLTSSKHDKLSHQKSFE